MTISYHNHTRWSDGASSVAELIDAARAAGLDEIGISDHYVLHPARAVSWSMPLDRLGEYVAEIRDAGAAAEGVQVRIGVEADYFPETMETLRGFLDLYSFDYVIGSVHFVDEFGIDGSAKPWEPLGQSEIDEIWRLYWRRVAQMATSGVYDFAAHLDLPKKFGYRPAADLTRESDAALDALAAAGMAIEINTAGWNKPAGEAYPSLELLQAARARGIPLLINADAHMPKDLTRGFDRARELARQAGYTEVSRYEGRVRSPIPL